MGECKRAWVRNPTSNAAPCPELCGVFWARNACAPLFFFSPFNGNLAPSGYPSTDVRGKGLRSRGTGEGRFGMVSAEVPRPAREKSTAPAMPDVQTAASAARGTRRRRMFLVHHREGVW